MSWCRYKIRRLWRLAGCWLFWRPVPFDTVHANELPDNLRRRTIYLIGENNFFWFAGLLCPCGCESVIQLNLIPEVRPRWLFEEHADGTVSLTPSIWSRRGCGSHYFLKRGLIVWHLG